MYNTYKTEFEMEYIRKIRRNKIRRARQLRRRVLISAILLVSLFTIVFGTMGIKANAQSSNDEHLYKYYKSVVVNNNDSLWNYALEYSKDDNYNNYINEVMIINHLNDDKIVNGMNIILPYYSTEFNL